MDWTANHEMRRKQAAAHWATKMKDQKKKIADARAAMAEAWQAEDGSARVRRAAARISQLRRELEELADARGSFMRGKANEREQMRRAARERGPLAPWVPPPLEEIASQRATLDEALAGELEASENEKARWVAAATPMYIKNWKKVRGQAMPLHATDDGIDRIDSTIAAGHRAPVVPTAGPGDGGGDGDGAAAVADKSAITDSDLQAIFEDGQLRDLLRQGTRDPWRGTILAHYTKCGNDTKGNFGERLVTGLLHRQNLLVFSALDREGRHAPKAEFDRVVADSETFNDDPASSIKRVEIKFAVSQKTKESGQEERLLEAATHHPAAHEDRGQVKSGKLTFNHIGAKKNWDRLLLVGFLPDNKTQFGEAVHVSQPSVISLWTTKRDFLSLFEGNPTGPAYRIYTVVEENDNTIKKIANKLRLNETVLLLFNTTPRGKDQLMHPYDERVLRGHFFDVRTRAPHERYNIKFNRSSRTITEAGGRVHEPFSTETPLPRGTEILTGPALAGFSKQQGGGRGGNDDWMLTNPTNLKLFCAWPGSRLGLNGFVTGTPQTLLEKNSHPLFHHLGKPTKPGKPREWIHLTPEEIKELKLTGARADLTATRSLSKPPRPGQPHRDFLATDARKVSKGRRITEKQLKRVIDGRKLPFKLQFGGGRRTRRKKRRKRRKTRRKKRKTTRKRRRKRRRKTR